MAADTLAQYWNNIDWPTTSSVTAAWFQAIGAIAALGVAIWIDHRASERLRKDRLEEDKRRRDERRLEKARIETARLHTIFYASGAFAAAAGSVRAMKIGVGDEVRLAPQFQQRIRGAEGAINALLGQSAEIAPEVLGALALASQVMGYWRSRAEGEQPCFGPAAQASYVQTLTDAKAALGRIYDDAALEMEAAQQYRAE